MREGKAVDYFHKEYLASKSNLLLGTKRMGFSVPRELSKSLSFWIFFIYHDIVYNSCGKVCSIRLQTDYQRWVRQALSVKQIEKLNILESTEELDFDELCGSFSVNEARFKKCTNCHAIQCITKLLASHWASN